MKKSDGSGGEVRTQASSDVRANVAALFGSSVARELIDFSLDETDSPLKFKAEGCVTNANYNAKKFTLLLFINNRLVDSGALRRAIDMVYSAYLPKGTHPFVYMSLQIAPSHVDVNVHPTKHEVHFLNQDEIVEKVQRGLDAKLLGSNSSRTFVTQALLPGAPVPKHLMEPEEEGSATISKQKAEAPKNMVRTDAREQKLDKFLTVSKPDPPPPPKAGEQAEESEAMVVDSHEKDTSSSRTDEKQAKRHQQGTKRPAAADTVAHRRTVKLASVQKMRQRLEDQRHEGLRDLVANHTFVGCVDRQFALLQHGTKLYLANNLVLSESFFYQVAIEDFANFEACFFQH